jgi:hypothetical protein
MEGGASEVEEDDGHTNSCVLRTGRDSILGLEKEGRSTNLDYEPHVFSGQAE